MIRVFLLLLTLSISSWFLADNLKQKGPGFVWIYFDHYSLETSFWFFCLLLIVLVVLLYLAVRLLDITIFFAFRAGLLPKKWGESRYRVARSLAETAYSEGNWLEAINLFKKTLNKKREFAQALLATRAAINAADLAQADDFYEQAKECSDLSEVSLGILQLDIAIARKADGRIKEILSRLQRDFPKDKIVAAKAFEFYCKTYRWQKAEAFYALAQKSSFINLQDMQKYEGELQLGLLKEAANNHDLKALDKRFKQLKGIAVINAEANACYLAGLLNSGDALKAERHGKALLKQGDYESINLAVAAVTLDVTETVKVWLQELLKSAKDESSNGELFLSVAKAAEYLHDAHLAIEYYEKALAFSYSKDSLLALINLCLLEEKHEKAKKYMAVLQSAL